MHMKTILLGIAASIALLSAPAAIADESTFKSGPCIGAEVFMTDIAPFPAEQRETLVELQAPGVANELASKETIIRGTEAPQDMVTTIAPFATVEKVGPGNLAGGPKDILAPGGGTGTLGTELVALDDSPIDTRI